MEVYQFCEGRIPNYVLLTQNQLCAVIYNAFKSQLGVISPMISDLQKCQIIVSSLALHGKIMSFCEFEEQRALKGAHLRMVSLYLNLINHIAY